MSYFTEEALKKFNEMCAAGVDFGEEATYDFARCVKTDGTVYGTKGQCKVGRPVGESEEKEDSKTDSRMSKLKREFIKKIGREMTPKEIAKAANMLGIGVPIPKGQSAEDVLQKMLPKGAKVHPVKEA